MPAAIVECIPNFSEARRPEAIESIIQAVVSVPGVRLLDRHSDMDHNRTVLTFVGPPQQVEEAAFRAIAEAAKLINLERHTGEHPRIGATDVVPFVPISGISMEECIQMAHRLGRRVGEELEIPVYMYEEAATRPERRNLEDIRHGQYEALKEEIGVKPEREPDYGPSRVGEAGATVIGARQPLIAYNVYLTSSDVSVAKRVAKAIRFSSGGLRYVKALGLEVDGQAQVSINLTNFRGTPIQRVVEMIRREASRYGVSIHHSELVGLIPQEALIDASVWYLQLDQFNRDQILESKLQESRDDSQGPGYLENIAFLESLAAGTATPGGGSAAAFSGAMAAALAAMVARLTVGKKKYSEVETQMQSILQQAEELRAQLTADVQRDAAAFEAVMGAYRLPKSTLEEQETQQQAIEQANLGAARVPLDVARGVLEAMKLIQQVVAKGNLNAISDAGTAFALARAALSGAGLNIRINLNSLQDTGLAQDLLNELQSLEHQADQLEKAIQNDLLERGGISLS